MGGRRIITKELAEKIAKKLEAVIRKDGPHDVAEIWIAGKLIVSFGIRRGSEKDLGHDYIPAAIFLNAFKAKLLAQCPMSKQQWISALQVKGKI